MIIRVSTAAVLSLLFAGIQAVYGNPPASGTLVLKRATVIDGNGGPPLPGRTLIIENGRIADVFGDGEKPVPADADVRDMGGFFIMPGLIDSHVHISGSTDECLTRALMGGVTTIREMGGDGAYLKTLQKAIERGEIDAPDIYFSAIMGGPEFIQQDGRVRLATPPSYALGTAPWARGVDETTNLRAVVREAKACGAIALKLYAGLSAGLVRRLTEEAHRQGLRVWAHSAVSPANVEDVVEAGVDSVSHAVGFLLPPAWRYGQDNSLAVDPRLLNPERMSRLAEAMKKSGTFLDPTLAIGRESLERASGDPDKRHWIEGLWSKVVRDVHKAGVPVVAGTDFFLPQAAGQMPAIHREMRLLVELAGLTPLEAITAATKNGALCLGLDRTFGTIEPGRAADLLVLKKDPSATIENTTAIAFVVKRGKIISPDGGR